ncbi:MAG TPA: Minf_1886 family protein [Verrucomicrobiae bacterium]|nr:Minf_1886 family protein [Verrucomicrobiae bacterium]
MQAASFEEALDQVLAKDRRYHRDAYLFLREALDYTRKMLDRDAKAEKSGRRAILREQHVSGQQLLEGIRELALEMFGPMVITVFEEWGVRSCQDFGEMVFILVENQLLKKTDKDSRADFENGYDFKDAFRKPFLPSAKVEVATEKTPKLTKT